ncbi:MAG: cell division protein ZapA [Gemmatimonadaceae bacterium]|nr:cell division protein ZapA [Gemmatimonadaceae bacterium]
MSGQRHVTKVRIHGEEYTIRSEVPPERTRAAAAHVDEAIRTVMASGAVIETHKAAILAAMSIADELFAMRGERSELAGDMAALSSELRRWLPPGKRGETPTG